jgi:CBS domain-containing protein
MKSKRLAVKDFCVRQVITVEADATIVACARMMHDGRVGSIVVVENRGKKAKPVGILTDRDIATRVVAFELDARTLTAGDVMTPPLVSAQDNEDVIAVLARMRAHGIRRLPVIDAEGNLVGIVAAVDLLEVLSAEVDGLVRILKSEQIQEVNH